jgi:hypothetical protein
MIPLLPQGVLRKQGDPDVRLNLKLPPASAGGIQRPELSANSFERNLRNIRGFHAGYRRQTFLDRLP